MKSVLVDSKDNIIYEGKDAKEVLKVLLADPSNVTEEDEIKYEDQLRNLKWSGKLEYQLHFELKFRGIDDWYRPVFKDVDSTLHFGDVNKLWTFEESKDNKLINYYKENPYALEYFGSKFNCEPQGGTQPFFKFKIVE